jgi:hypothetical protein
MRPEMVDDLLPSDAARLHQVSGDSVSRLDNAALFFEDRSHDRLSGSYSAS